MGRFRYILIVIALLLVTGGCRKHYTPRPRGYPRIDLPTHAYTRYKADCPFSFDYPVYTTVHHDSSRLAEPCWLNIDYPSFRGRIHVSYKAVAGNLGKLTEDSRNFVYSHVSKADGIDETLLNYPDRQARRRGSQSKTRGHRTVLMIF